MYDNTLTLVEDINIVELTQIMTQQLNTALQIDLGNIELSAVSQFVIQSTSLITSTDVTLGAITTGLIQQLGDLQWESITLAEVEQWVIQQAAGLQQLNAARNIELESIIERIFAIEIEVLGAWYSYFQISNKRIGGNITANLS